jgi:hypothetical protein
MAKKQTKPMISGIRASIFGRYCPRNAERAIENPSATPAQIPTATYGSNSVSTNRCLFPPRGKQLKNTTAVSKRTRMPVTSRTIPDLYALRRPGTYAARARCQCGMKAWEFAKVATGDRSPSGACERHQRGPVSGLSAAMVTSWSAYSAALKPSVHASMRHREPLGALATVRPQTASAGRCDHVRTRN